MSDLHDAALQGFSRAAVSYGRGRPGYPDELLAWLRQTLRLGPERMVVDLGAGTGKFSPLLLRTGADVLAVEPIEAMRMQLLQSLPGLTVIPGTAQSMPLEDASVDAVVCAQAFHWFANRQALQEIHRVLRPDGKLGLVWNVRDESVDWVAAITAIMAPYEGDAPRFHSGQWRRLFPNELFTAPEEFSLPHQHTGSAQQVIMDRFLSVSFIAALPPAQQAEVAARLGALIATHPQLKDRQMIAVPYQTLAFCCERLPLAGARTEPYKEKERAGQGLTGALQR
jgi:SAM-dependent methyltransferase